MWAEINKNEAGLEKANEKNGRGVKKQQKKQKTA